MGVLHLGATIDPATGAMGRRAAQNKVPRMLVDLERLETELAVETVDIGARWSAAAAEATTMEATPTKTNIAVTDLTLAWVPVL